MRHSTYGLVDTSSLTLDVNAYVTAISPSSGSMFGGTLITITGTNFGTEATDNPVQLFGGGIRNGVNCYVESTSATQIKCRVDSDTTSATADSQASVNVFLKLSEDASCADSVCKDTWTYTSSIPIVESVSTDFDSSLKEYIMTVNGTDFTGSTSTTTFSVNGVA